ncbi:hypothetical protein ACSAZL_21945 [Methanosarcina sp. T3]|uniref:hypothetical protein n=1 Tax=Methanosarcina sp. T3 TaxID=3439062 RepID=UPI003F874A94
MEEFNDLQEYSGKNTIIEAIVYCENDIFIAVKRKWGKINTGKVPDSRSSRS